MSVKIVRQLTGYLWILDGLLQLQPKMFTSAFATKIILPMANGQPEIVSLPMHWAASLFLMKPIIFNSFIVAIQLTIGVLILSKKTARVGLLMSMIWGLLVWSIGEAYGGILSGSFSLMMGAPGAGLIYAILSLSIYKKQDDERPSFWLVFVWLAIWLFGAISFVLDNHSLNAINAMLRSNLNNLPGWLAYVDNQFSNFIGSLYSHATFNSNTMGMAMGAGKSVASNPGYWLIIVFGLIELTIGLGVLLNSKIRKTAITSGCIILVFFWLVGQNAGNYYSGLMTDLNTAPILIIMGLVLLKNDYTKPLLEFGQFIKNKII